MVSSQREREQTVAKELLNVKKRKSSLIFMLFYAKNKGKMMAKLKLQLPLQRKVTSILQNTIPMLKTAKY